ncbi:1-pyrroline-5-carboxylate dehydrogenase [Frankia canadensis]|uniref:L-glutamate gamma-semialdehyde dehydrogenase n=1 Tax=Frankia canadensis TaxID=1836972 RepID=A0A2I2KJX4_9ACTN|nr:L-glutamate gamma-semialdehyde dehydrogenase [Frankia canadensis]SNQ45960.1 1-pyrroline-5-carboxylate dehydrogenase [Frankia canadensis]SOU53250.1 1-pyrroline-5-carboxylate dehydrogenase [Frankia canadensis]
MTATGFTVPDAVNEVPLTYAPGSSERAGLRRALLRLGGEHLELTNTIGGRSRPGSGPVREVVQPHAHRRVLGSLRESTHADAAAAVAAAKQAAGPWRECGFVERAAVFLRAAEALAGPWRDTLNAATMLGQSKTCLQAEIDAACELIDYWRYNVMFAAELHGMQPRSGVGEWNRLDLRPLEGFVYAVTPFNFTAIAGNLPTAPALMGNTVVWKPAPAQAFAAHFLMRLLEAAGLPPGVINLVGGSGESVSDVVFSDPDLAGVHFTGSAAVFARLWRAVADNLDGYRGYPRIVGETGGKDFVVAHPSADVDVLRTALVRGAFEYSGQKCSAASRAYLPASLWRRMDGELAAATEALSIGDINDFGHFSGAVIDDRAYARLAAACTRAANDSTVTVLAGAQCDDSVGWFVRPTILVGTDPGREWFTRELFGPILSVHVYDDSSPQAWDDVLHLVDRTSDYALTGAVVATDRAAITRAEQQLRYAAGNFYINDKPTGAVVGRQPFGGARRSGTDDKAGSAHHLMRWVSPRVVKENLAPPVAHDHPHMGHGGFAPVGPARGDADAGTSTSDGRRSGRGGTASSSQRDDRRE